MSYYSDLFDSLQGHIDSLEKCYILLHESPEATPEDFGFDVRAFCVLSHAAMEDYIEQVCIKLADDAVKNYTNYKKVSDVTVCLIAHYGGRYITENDDSDKTSRTFNRLRDLLTDVKRKLSNDTHRNHGIAIKYMRQLLYPVAIDIPEDVNLRNSLHQLTKERGEFAHKLAVKRYISPEDAKTYVNDCLQLCHLVCQSAEKKEI